MPCTKFLPAREHDDDNSHENDDDLMGRELAIAIQVETKTTYVSDSGVDVSPMPATNNDPLGSNSKAAPLLHPSISLNGHQSFNSGNTGGVVALVEMDRIVKEQRQVLTITFKNIVRTTRNTWNDSDRSTIYYYIIVIHTDWHCLRLGAATVYLFRQCLSNDSALFVNLPLNCFLFMMGVLCSRSTHGVIGTRFTPPHLQQSYEKSRLCREEANDEAADAASGAELVWMMVTGDEEDAVMMPLATDSDDDEVTRSDPENNSGRIRRLRRRQRKRQRSSKNEVKVESIFWTAVAPRRLHAMFNYSLWSEEYRASKCLVLSNSKGRCGRYGTLLSRRIQARGRGITTMIQMIDLATETCPMTCRWRVETGIRTNAATRVAVNILKTKNTPVHANSESKTADSPKTRNQSKDQNDVGKEQKQGTPW
jgi:hypothetical protein